TVPVRFTVENRGAGDPGNFQVEVLLASNNLFGSSSTLSQTFTRADLTVDLTGRRFSSPAGFAITLPTGLPSGPLFVGVRIDPDPAVLDAGLFDKSGVHRGSDFETLTVLTPVPAGVRDLSQADPTLNTRVDANLL